MNTIHTSTRAANVDVPNQANQTAFSQVLDGQIQDTPVADYVPELATLRSVKSRLGFLASDALGGRGSGTRHEWIAAAYIASEFEAAGLLPAGDVMDDGSVSYIQHINVGSKQEFVAPPQLTAGDVNMTHGEDIMFFKVRNASVSGPLRTVDLSEPRATDAVKPGDVVYLKNTSKMMNRTMMSVLQEMDKRGVGAVVIPTGPQFEANWQDYLQQITTSVNTFNDPKLDREAGIPTYIGVRHTAVEAFEDIADGTSVTLGGDVHDHEVLQTWNVFGKLPGKTDETILLTSHLDHLGIKDNGTDDHIYNGANDDASGVVAVLEMTDMMTKMARDNGPHDRTVVFGAFGAEEIGLWGSKHFAGNPTQSIHLNDVIANLEFEMIARIPDEQNGTIWLPGFERSTLGPYLNEQGGNFAPDPHTNLHLFYRSDNYPIAETTGIVAHAPMFILGEGFAGVGPHYHQPSDDMDHVDLDNMVDAINMMATPIIKLANDDFIPQWNEGMDPSQKQ